MPKVLCNIIVALSLVAVKPMMKIDQCELCEIALQEGHHFMVRMLNDNKGKAVSLEKEFETLRKEYNTWAVYNNFYKKATQMFYLDDDKKDTHWHSIMWKFHNVYGATDFHGDEKIKGTHFGGAVDAFNVRNMWQRECYDISGFCKKSELREPAFKSNTCGTCRTVVREVTIGLRRRANIPGEVKLSQVETVTEQVCEALLMFYPEDKSKKMWDACEELMEDMDNSLVKLIHKTMLATGDVDWPNTEKGFTDVVEEAVCLDNSEACSSEKAFNSAVDGADELKKKKANNPYAKKEL